MHLLQGVVISAIIVFTNGFDNGPPHDLVTGGNYTFESMNWEKEVPLAKPTKSECDDMKFKRHPDLKLNVPDYFERYGYSYETHRVHTEDGYTLTVYRITGSALSPPKPGKVPVYLNHGLAGNAWSWFFLPDNRSLAFKLANEGFDVFISNARGSSYSSGHRNLSQADDAYWDYSFHELGYYDVPAVIDHILAATKMPDLYYVGHSLGTCQFLIATSLRPELVNKIRVGFLLATAGYVGNMAAPGLRLVLGSHTPLEEFRQFAPKFTDAASLKALTGTFADAACQIAAATDFAKNCGSCDLLGSKIFGINEKQVSVRDGSFFNEKYFSTQASKVFMHLSQELISREFRQYDYGKGNLERYGVPYPPKYPLEDIRVPIVNFWGYSDHVTVPQDVQLTMGRIKVVKENNRVPIKSFDHLDFLIGKDVEKHVHNRLTWIMKTGLYTKYHDTTASQTA